VVQNLNRSNIDTDTRDSSIMKFIEIYMKIYSCHMRYNALKTEDKYGLHVEKLFGVDTLSNLFKKILFQK